MELVASRVNSLLSKILFKCFVIACRCVPKSSAICDCESQTVSWAILTSRFIELSGWYNTISPASTVLGRLELALTWMGKLSCIIVSFFVCFAIKNAQTINMASPYVKKRYFSAMASL